MGKLFEELDYWPTPIGALSLRRRRELKLGIDIYEIKLGDEYVMTSAVTASEEALARLGVAALGDRENLGVAVGGLGLGYTARAVLEHANVAELLVIEFLEGVVQWHRDGLVPLGPELTGDPRCRIVQGDFFALARGQDGVDPEAPGRRFDAILVDIDHSPRLLLDDRSENFYSADGLREVARHLAPGGVFGLWSNDRPDPSFAARLDAVFAEGWSEPVTFHNPLQDRPFTQTVYLARAAAD